MLNFNELRITQDGKYLIIDASISNQDFYDNIILDRVIIDTQDTYIPNGPSSNPIYEFKVVDAYDLTYSLPEECGCNPVLMDEDKSYCFTYGTSHLRNIRLKLKAEDINTSTLNNMMFFVYVIADGTPSENTPCGMANPIIMGAVSNLYPFYQSMMKYVKQIENNCEIPKKFIDFILRFKALELSIKVGNYPQAIKYWNKYFKNKIGVVSTSSNCNCYG